MNHLDYSAMVEEFRRPPVKAKGIVEDYEDGLLVLRSADVGRRRGRRVLFVSDYGMAKAWRLWRNGVYPSNHLWGAVELALMGYDVLLPEPVTSGGWDRRVRSDWFPALSAILRLDRSDIVYCGHNVLLWTPIFKALGRVRASVVGMLYAREPLPFGRRYDAVIAHTPVAYSSARRRYPGVLTEHISWGMDLEFFQAYDYDNRWMLSCGKTYRDFGVLAEAFRDGGMSGVVVHPEPGSLAGMPEDVVVESARVLGEGIYTALVHHFYRFAGATVLTVRPDPTSRRSIGITNVLESMACARPVVVTRTSALTSELDVESLGIGRFVPPEDAVALRDTLLDVVGDRDSAIAMGKRGREICERTMNIERFAKDLSALFERL